MRRRHSKAPAPGKPFPSGTRKKNSVKHGHAALTPSSDVVTDAMHSLRPKHASFGRFDGGTSNLSHVEHLVRTCGNRDQFFKMQDGRTWRKLFEVHPRKKAAVLCPGQPV